MEEGDTSAVNYMRDMDSDMEAADFLTDAEGPDDCLAADPSPLSASDDKFNIPSSPCLFSGLSINESLESIVFCEFGEWHPVRELII